MSSAEIFIQSAEGYRTNHVVLLHYENTPIQIYRKFHLQKLKMFQIKKTLIFFIFLIKTLIVGTR